MQPLLSLVDHPALSVVEVVEVEVEVMRPLSLLRRARRRCLRDYAGPNCRRDREKKA